MCLVSSKNYFQFHQGFLQDFWQHLQNSNWIDLSLTSDQWQLFHSPPDIYFQSSLLSLILHRIFSKFFDLIDFTPYSFGALWVCLKAISQMNFLIPIYENFYIISKVFVFVIPKHIFLFFKYFWYALFFSLILLSTSEFTQGLLLNFLIW